MESYSIKVGPSSFIDYDQSFFDRLHYQSLCQNGSVNGA